PCGWDLSHEHSAVQFDDHTSKFFASCRGEGEIHGILGHSRITDADVIRRLSLRDSRAIGAQQPYTQRRAGKRLRVLLSVWRISTFDIDDDAGWLFGDQHHGDVFRHAVSLKQEHDSVLRKCAE